MSKVSPNSARWGMLVTTLLMGIILVAAGIVGYLGARESSAAVVRARSLDLVFSIKRELRFASSHNEGQLGSLLAEMQGQGVRFIGLIDSSKTFVAMAGRPVGQIGELPEHQRPCGEPHSDIKDASNHVRVVSALPGGPGRRGMRGRHDTERGCGGIRLVVEFEPVLAQAIVNRAKLTLVLSVVSAAVLFCAAGLFWRLSRKAAQMSEQLFRDRQLKSLGEMSAVLSHELRNPLASLKGHVQLLLEKLQPDHPSYKGAQRVLHETLRLEGLSNEILEFARTGSIVRKSEDPQDIARSVIEATDSQRICLLCKDPIPMWQLDRSRMAQVLINLLRNALQASPDEAKVELSVAVQHEALIFEVRDHGPGLERGDEEQIFEPFRTGHVKGTGLGLAVARQIVTGHGGLIEGRSHPAGGAVFRIELPKAGEEVQS